MRSVIVDDLSTGSERNVPAGARLERLDIVDGGASVCGSCPPLRRASSVTSPRRRASSCPWNRPSATSRSTCRVPSTSCRPPREVAREGGVRIDRRRAVWGERAASQPGDDARPSRCRPTAHRSSPARPTSGHGAGCTAIPNVVLRLGNVYGPRQNSKGEAGVVAIFSDLLRRREARPPSSATAFRRATTYTSGTSRAPSRWPPSAGQAATFNVGRGSESSVLDLLEVLQSLAPLAVEPSFAPLRPGELTRSALDSTRLRSDAGMGAAGRSARGSDRDLRFYADAPSVNTAGPV